MRMAGITLVDFAAAVAKANRSYDGNLMVHQDAHQVGVRAFTTIGRVRCVASRKAGSRTSWDGRHTPTTCWHGYRDVLRALFEINPKAVITTSMAQYRGVEGFEENYPRTGHINIGSMFAPAYMPELCDCDDDEGRY